MKFLMILLSFGLTLLLGSACKQDDHFDRTGLSKGSSSPQVNTESDAVVADAEEARSKAPLAIYLLGDDAHMLMIPKKTIEANQDNTQLDALLHVAGSIYAISIDEYLNQYFDAEDKNELGLARVTLPGQILSPLPTKVIVNTKRVVFRSVEFIQTVIEAWQGGSQRYFFDALEKKRVDPNFTNFNKMPSLESEVGVFKDLKPKQVSGTSVTLGMLPSQKIINDVRESLGRTETDKSKQNLSGVFQIHMSQDFEINKALDDLKASDVKVLSEQKQSVIRRFNVKVSGSSEDFHIYTSKQYRVQDRRFVPPDILSDATATGIRALNRGDSLYIHCKGGRSRSATTVISIRVVMMIEAAKVAKKVITKSDVDALIKEQTDLVKEARREVSISIKNTNSMQIVAYQAAGII